MIWLVEITVGAHDNNQAKTIRTCACAVNKQNSAPIFGEEMVYLTLGAGAGEDTILWMSEKALGPGVNWGNSLARQKMCAQLRGRSGPHHVLIPPGYIVLSCLVI